MYEVLLGSKGLMQLGWCSLNCKFNHSVNILLYITNLFGFKILFLIFYYLLVFEFYIIITQYIHLSWELLFMILGLSLCVNFFTLILASIICGVCARARVCTRARVSIVDVFWLISVCTLERVLLLCVSAQTCDSHLYFLVTTDQ